MAAKLYHDTQCSNIEREFMTNIRVFTQRLSKLEQEIVSKIKSGEVTLDNIPEEWNTDQHVAALDKVMGKVSG